MSIHTEILEKLSQRASTREKVGFAVSHGLLVWEDEWVWRVRGHGIQAESLVGPIHALRKWCRDAERERVDA